MARACSCPDLYHLGGGSNLDAAAPRRGNQRVRQGSWTAARVDRFAGEAKIQRELYEKETSAREMNQITINRRILIISDSIMGDYNTLKQLTQQLPGVILIQ